MNTYCDFSGYPEYDNEVKRLTEVFHDKDLAIAALSLNNGNPFGYNPDGSPSVFYNTVKASNSNRGIADFLYLDRLKVLKERCDSLNIPFDISKEFYQFPANLNLIKTVNHLMNCIKKAGIEVRVISQDAAKQITASDNIEIMRTSTSVYGYFDRNTNVIYLTPEGFKKETLVHEYTHLWTKVVALSNPLLWDRISSVLKQTDLYNRLLNSGQYIEEYDILTETLAQLTATSDLVKNSGEENFVQTLRNSLRTFWNYVKEFFGLSKSNKVFTDRDHDDNISVDKVVNSVLSDLVNITPLDIPIPKSIETEYQEIAKLNGEKLRQLNLGYTLDYAPNGAKSLLYSLLLEYAKAKYPNATNAEHVQIARILKSKVYSEEFRKQYGDWLNAVLYTAWRVEDKNKLMEIFPSALPNKFYDHATIKYGSQQWNSRQGIPNKLKAIGRLTTDVVDCLIVIDPDTQKEYHITLATNNNSQGKPIPPVISNLEILKHRENIVYFKNPISIDTVFTNYLKNEFNSMLDLNGEPCLIVYNQGIFDFVINYTNSEWINNILGYLPNKFNFTNLQLNLQNGSTIIPIGTTAVTNLESKRFDFSTSDSELDPYTKDLCGLIVYQLQKEGADINEIKQAIRGFLSAESYYVNYVTYLRDKIIIRQAQLHQLGYDYNPEKTVNGLFDWASYLGDIDLTKEIESEKDIDPNKFTKIENYKVDLAEVIVPKLYKSKFHLGNKSLAEITPDYFKRVNTFYDRANKDSDFIIRTHTGKYEILFVDEFSQWKEEHKNFNLINYKRDGDWLLDLNGKKKYCVKNLSNIDYKVFKDLKGNEIIVVKKTVDILKAVKSLIKNDLLVSIQPLCKNINPTLELIKLAILENSKTIDTHNPALKKLLKENFDTTETRKLLEDIYIKYKAQYISDLSHALYNSFIETLKIVSARIPTQALSSIMTAKVVGLTNSKSNEVFVTRWQFWLQGSDLDIDKSYMLGVDISDSGQYSHWSPLADFKSKTSALISKELPIPNGIFIALKDNYYEAPDDSTIIELKDDPYASFKGDVLSNLVLDWITLYDKDEEDISELAQKYNVKNLDSLNNYKFAKAILLKIEALILNYIDKNKDFTIKGLNIQNLNSQPGFSILLGRLNEHNAHKISIEESRNVLHKSIADLTTLEVNMLSGYHPIDVLTAAFKNLLSNSNSSKLIHHLDDGLFIHRLQFANAVGKDGVAICANALKSFLAVTQVLNVLRKDPDFQNSKGWFILKLTVNGKTKFFNTISDIRFEREAIKVYTDILVGCMSEEEKQKMNSILQDVQLYTSDKDATLLISALLSLATDNAKELALAKMNASQDLLCMHLLLCILGYNNKDIVQFTTSPEFTAIAKKLNRSILEGNVKVEDAILETILKRTSINQISTKTEAYGVEISKNSEDFWDKINNGWQEKHPEGLVAYRKYGNKPETFTSDTVNDGWIGNPFSTETKGPDTVLKFYDWLITGNNFGNSLANEEFRQAIISKILSTPNGSPILYYAELGRPSHATVLGYLIEHKELLNRSLPSSDINSSDEDDILQVYKLALEYTRLSRLLKTNLGTKVDESELDKMVLNFETAIVDLLKPVNIVISEGDPYYRSELDLYPLSEYYGMKMFLFDKMNMEPSDKLIDQYLEKLKELQLRTRTLDVYSMLLDTHRYFNDPEYRQLMVDWCDFYKLALNPLSIINNLPHYYKMMESFIISKELLKKVSSRAKLMLESRLAYEAHKISVYGNVQVLKYDFLSGMIETKTVRRKVIDFKPYGKEILLQAGRYYDDYILSELLQDNKDNLTFKYQSGTEEVTLDLTTNDGILEFCKWVAYDIIPQLQENDSENNNEFLKRIVPNLNKVKKDSSIRPLPAYKYNFDIDRMLSGTDRNLSWEVKDGFKKLTVNEEGKLITLGEIPGIKDWVLGFTKNVPLGEILVLYNMLTNINGFGQTSLETGFEFYLLHCDNIRYESFVIKKAKIIRDHDLKIRPEIKLDPVKFLAFCYQNEIKRYFDGKMEYDYNKETKKSQHYDISKFVLFNLEDNTYYQDLKFLRDYESFKLAWKNNKIQFIIEDGQWVMISQYDSSLHENLGKAFDFSFKDLLSALLELKEKGKIPELISKIKNLSVNDDEKTQRKLIPEFFGRRLLRQLKDRLKLLGVDVHIVEGTGARVENGELYIGDNANMASAVHEMMHIFLAVLKTDNYSLFQKLVNLLEEMPIFKTILDNVKSSSTYANLMDLDKKEEALCRTIEAIVEDKLSEEDIIIFDKQYDIFSDILKYAIGKTLDIYPPENILSFLKTPLSGMSRYGYDWIKRENSGTGYIDQKIKVIESGKISNYIKSLIEQLLIKETEC